MKAKIISKVLNQKLNDFANSITDESVKKLVLSNSIITGGCIASMLLKEKINDFDVYFTDKITVLAVAEYYTKAFNVLHNLTGKDTGYVLDGDVPNERNLHSEGGVAMNMTPDRVKIIFDGRGPVGVGDANPLKDDDELDNLEETEDKGAKYRPIYLSCNAITLSHQVQIIIRFYGQPDEIHQYYDYVHCTNYWLSSTGQLTLHLDALKALLEKQLIYVGSKYPLASIIRTRKFIKRGWTINAGQYLKMCMQLNELDLSDIYVLEDQLVGVDAAFFGMLIQALQKHAAAEKEAGKEFKIESSYLVTIVDKIF